LFSSILPYTTIPFPPFIDEIPVDGGDAEDGEGVDEAPDWARESKKKYQESGMVRLEEIY